jgi:hypothetical protein
MDCKKADIALLQYAEKTIKPAAASALAKHVLTCENCRELFLAFDEAIESAGSLTDEAPAGFTENVMKEIHKLPPHIKIKDTLVSDTIMRVFSGVCALLMGFGLLLAETPLSNMFTAAGGMIQNSIHWFLYAGSQLGATASAAFPSLAISALFFLCIVGAALAVLLRNEKIKV